MVLQTAQHPWHPYRPGVQDIRGAAVGEIPQLWMVVASLLVRLAWGWCQAPFSVPVYARAHLLRIDDQAFKRSGMMAITTGMLLRFKARTAPVYPSTQPGATVPSRLV
jgi:hypothetical protein